MSARALWFAVSLVLFVGYAIAFFTLGSTAYAHGFEDATVPMSLIVGTIVVLLGLLLFLLGLKAAIQTRSARASWPSLVLGSSLIAAAGCDWWISSLGHEWGWSSISNSLISLDPFAWQSIFTTPYSGSRWGSEAQLYVVINLCLLAMIAVSGTTVVHRLRPSVRTGRSARSSGLVLIIGMLAEVSAAWVWVIDLTGQNQAPVFIASAVTIAAVSTSLDFSAPRGYRSPLVDWAIGSAPYRREWVTWWTSRRWLTAEFPERSVPARGRLFIND